MTENTTGHECAASLAMDDYRAGVIRELAETFEARGEQLHLTGWPWHASRQMTAAEVLREELARGDGA